MRATKEALLAGALAEADVPTSRGMVRVRALTSAEHEACKGAPLDQVEVALLASCLVDPALTTDEVLAWRQSASHRDVEEVVQMIWALSKPRA